MNLLQKLSGSQFYTIPELAVIFECSNKNSRIKFTRFAQRENRQIQIKTFVEDGKVNVRYKLSKKPYVTEYECCDPVRKSTITWQEIVNSSHNMGNNSYDMLCTLFEMRDNYCSFESLSDVTGNNNARRVINNLEICGFVFHRRNNKANREVKLVGFKHKKSNEVKTIEHKSSMKLINEVFR